MAILINEDCINCDACRPECPNTAIYEPGENWTLADGTELSGSVTLADGTVIDADAEQEPLSDEFYFIVTAKCTECVGFHDEPQCAAVCPVDSCVPDEEHVESKEDLESKKAFLHAEG